MTNVVKRLLYDQQKDWFNKNNWSIFQDHLLSKGATTYRYPRNTVTGSEEKLSFSGNIKEPWQQIGEDIDGEADGDFSGYSVSLSADGSIVAIGAIYNDGNGNSSGHVRVYEFKEGSWQQLGGDIDGEEELDLSGDSVSLSADGSIVAIGAPYNNGSFSGHVRVYEFKEGSWEQLGGDIDAEAAGDESGTRVSLSADGSIVAICAPYNDGLDQTDSKRGHVRVYRRNPGKTDAVTDETSPNYGPKGWDRIGGDIDGEAEGDRSGWSVSLSADGSIVAIGAPSNDGLDETDSKRGHVRVYEFKEGSWEQLGQDIDGEAAGDQSGISVSLSADGSIVAISAPFNDGLDETDTKRGHVRVYEFKEGSWEQLGQDIDGEGELDGQIAGAVSLSANGSIVTVGAPKNNGPNGIDSGHVRVYQYDGSIWEQLGVDIDGEAGEDLSGWSVSLSADGSMVAIGSYFANSRKGHVRVYRHNVLAGISQINHFNANPADVAKNIMVSRYGPQWEQVGADIDGTSLSDAGYSVSLSADGSVMAIGLRRANAENSSNDGKVQVYRYSENEDGIYAWHQIGEDIIGEGMNDYSGSAVSLSYDGFVVAIGAPEPLITTGEGYVKIYRYDENTDSWSQLGSTIQHETIHDETGHSVSLSADGSIVAVGSRGTQGYVRVYKYNSNLDKWDKMGLNIEGEFNYDESGTSVSLSADGSVVAIGAPLNDGNGTDSGHVRIYKYNDTDEWSQLGSDINGEAADHRSGTSVSLSADGYILAIGVIQSDENGSNSGHVRVFKYREYKADDIDETGESKFHHASTTVNNNQTKPLIITGDTNTPPQEGNFYWMQVGQDIDGEAALDKAGTSVSLSADGMVVAIGAHLNHGVNGDRSGHVRVYQYDPNKNVAQLNNPNLENYGPVGWNRIGQEIDGEAAGDESGGAVSLSADGSVVAIGAINNDGNGHNSGHVRVFQIAKRNSWVQQGLNIVDNDADDESGHSVSLNGDGSMLAIGSPKHNGNRGKVDVYVYENSKWISELSSYSLSDGYSSGHSVSLSKSGSVLAVSAIGFGGSRGKVDILEKLENGDWVQLGNSIVGESPSDESGWSVSCVDGREDSKPLLVAIGARWNDGPVIFFNDKRGSVRVYEYDPDGWKRVGQDIDGKAAGYESGYSVSLSADGTTLAIGAPNPSTISGYISHVKIFNLVEGWWQQQGGDIEEESSSNLSGWSVSLSGDGSRVAIGAIYNDGDSDSTDDNRGHVRVYQRDPDSPNVEDQSSPDYGPAGWKRVGQDIDGKDAGDLSGYSVSLSENGKILAIGANQNFSSKAGYTRVYRCDVNNEWVRLGFDFNGEDGDESSRSISLSGDGKMLAIGSRKSSGSILNSNENTGHVRVYKSAGWGLGT